MKRFIVVIGLLVTFSSISFAQCEKGVCLTKPLGLFRSAQVDSTGIVVNPGETLLSVGGVPVSQSRSFTPVRNLIKAASAPLQDLNQQRIGRGLFPLVQDSRLEACAKNKAQIQANRDTMFHPGGSFCGGQVEGVGSGPQFNSCYKFSRNYKRAGAASAVSRSGRIYHCLILGN